MSSALGEKAIRDSTATIRPARKTPCSCFNMLRPLSPRVHWPPCWRPVQLLSTVSKRFHPTRHTRWRQRSQPATQPDQYRQRLSAKHRRSGSP
jgi:hypothetical protein